MSDRRAELNSTLQQIAVTDIAEVFERHLVLNIGRLLGRLPLEATNKNIPCPASPILM